MSTVHGNGGRQGAFNPAHPDGQLTLADTPRVNISHGFLALVAVVGGGGCEQWKAADRVHELEGRVNELATEVSALAGKPVGGGGEHAPAAAAPAGDGRGSDAHADGDKPATEHADAHAEADKPTGAHGDLVASADSHGDKDRDKHKADKHDDGEKSDASHAPSKPPHWSYDGSDGPEHWGELSGEFATCAKGKAQSPIDISPRAGKASPIEFHYVPTAATIVDNGHTLQVNLAAGSSISIDDHSYQLVQFHVHTPSEHLIAGEHYPMELHLVHKDRDGKLAVVGVMYDVGSESKTLGSVWEHWPKKVGSEDKLARAFDPTVLLPETRSLFRYPGSLTTPPCTEGVVWNVLRRSMTDSKGHLAVLQKHYAANARPPVELGERAVE